MTKTEIVLMKNEKIMLITKCMLNFDVIDHIS